jgi:hypothetical protein
MRTSVTDRSACFEITGSRNLVRAADHLGDGGAHLFADAQHALGRGR